MQLLQTMQRVGSHFPAHISSPSSDSNFICWHARGLSYYYSLSICLHCSPHCCSLSQSVQGRVSVCGCVQMVQQQSIVINYFAAFVICYVNNKYCRKHKKSIESLHSQ